MNVDEFKDNSDKKRQYRTAVTVDAFFTGDLLPPVAAEEDGGCDDEESSPLSFCCKRLVDSTFKLGEESSSSRGPRLFVATTGVPRRACSLDR